MPVEAFKMPNTSSFL